jgi:hypothetical protein
MRFVEEYTPLSRAEAALISCIRKDRWCNLGKFRPEKPLACNTIRAGLLRAVLLDDREEVSGVHISGAYISGNLNLNGIALRRPLHVRHSTLKGELSFCDATLVTLQFEKSWLRAVRGHGAKFERGDLLFWNCDILCGAHLFGVDVAGTVSFAESKFGKSDDSRYKDGFAINLDTANIGGNLDLNKIVAASIIRLDDAKIRGKLDCSGGSFNANLKSQPQEAHDEESNPWVVPIRALSAYRLSLGGTIYFRGARCHGELSFTDAKIGGDIDCRNANFSFASSKDPIVVRFSRAQVLGNVYLWGIFVGKTEFSGSKIAGVLNCRGFFSVPKDVEATDLAASAGNAHKVNAHTVKSRHRGGKPPSAKKEREPLAFDAISLVNARIEGGLFLHNAVIDGSLDLKSAYARVLVDSKKSWPKKPVKHSVGASKIRPHRNVIHLDGFTFDRFGGGAPRDAATRMEWLSLQPRDHMGSDFRPQPFEQLIKVLKEMGHPEEVRNLSIKREKRLHMSRRTRWWKPGRRLPALSSLFATVGVGWMMGYGYRPLRVLRIMLLVGLLFGVFYDLAKDHDVFAPSDAQILVHEKARACKLEKNGQEVKDWPTCLAIEVPEYPRFNPYVYSLNVMFPVVDLFQQRSWLPVGKQLTFESEILGKVKMPRWTTEVAVWAELFIGWSLSILAVALFSGMIRKVRLD